MEDKEVKDSEKRDNRVSEVNESTRSRRGLIIGVSIAALVLVGSVIAGGAFLLNTLARERAERAPYSAGNSIRFSGGAGLGYGREVYTEITNDTVTTTVYTYLTGVVVAVNSDNIVVAGNGKQTTIQTNSSTTYTNDDKPAVNDTVVIKGTTADNKTTATEIRVANR